MVGRRIPVAPGVTEPKRMDQRDPRLPVADMFDPQIARRLWDSLPPECRSDHFNKKTMPDRYRNAVPEVSAGGPWTTCYLNFRGLPEPMTWEIAWLIHREIELGRFVNPNIFNAMTRILRAATSGGTKRGRRAQSLLQLTPEEWMRETQAARMRGYVQGEANDHVAQGRISQLQDVLVYPYHQGLWWQLNVWNPLLDNRIPRREHEPMGAKNASFTRLTSEWLREGAKLWLSANLSTGRYSWSTIKSRLDALKWLQRHIDQRGDEGPCLTADPHGLRPFIRGFCDMMSTHRIKVGKNTGQLLGKNPRRHVMVAIEQFYQWMYDHRNEAAATLGIPEWATLRPEHCVLFRPEDKPRLTNKRTSEVMVLDDDVMRRIAEGCDVLARPRADGGLGDIQAFHALMLLMRTGRRMNEVLMMDFDPLEPFHHTRGENHDSDDGEAFVARMRYQQTKIESTTPASIPVDAEIVAIIKAQQAFARNFLAAAGEPDRTPKYLFLRTSQNRLGTSPYPAGTLHLHLGELTEALAITDSTGRPVAISQTHRFRHTAATNLLNAGVPLHVVMRYFGHVSPEMTLHYAITLSRTMEDEFLKFKKVTRDGRTADMDPTDLYELLHIDKRADRILPNGWCTLPPKQLCDKGNACLSCSVFVTDASHAPELRRQLDATERLVDTRQTAFTAKYGAPMGEDNIWLKGRRDEIASLNRILLSITDVTDQAVRGAGVADQTE
ncbi:putative transposase/integrase [Mycobacteroides abscessus subsp. abscessus]|nr:tyrosine-type recombinase/integrase [Mycobacteroides abscessus]SKX63916.1 putative transposase/integrase [Mycobacteroides abscessus subsp. abscessus]